MSRPTSQPTLVEGDPLDATTLAGAFQRTSARYPDKTAIQTLDISERYTWSELAARVRRVAAGLASFGVGHGDTVAIVLPNTIDCHVIDYAAVHLGAVPFAIFNSAPSEQIEHQLRRGDATLVVTQHAFLDKVSEAAAALGDQVRHIEETAGELSATPWRSAAWEAHLHDVVLRGRRMHYLDVGEGPAVVLVHGLASAWAAWFCNIPELAAKHRVIAVDLPGFGRSDALARPVDIRHYVDAIVELLDHLGVGDVRIVGHSLGGVIAQQFAAGGPERTAALVVVASGGRPNGIREAIFRGLAGGYCAA